MLEIIKELNDLKTYKDQLLECQCSSCKREAFIPNEELINEAIALITSFPPVSKPVVVPMSRSRFELEWNCYKDGEVSLQIEFENLGQIHYLKWISEKGSTEEKFSEEGVVDSSNFQSLLGWFEENKNE